jgi:hypothetical protein
MLPNSNFAYAPTYDGVPALFNGDTPQVATHLPYLGVVGSSDTTPPQIGVVGITEPTEVAMFGPFGKALLRDRYDVWTKHQFILYSTGFAAQRSFGRTLLTDGGAVATSAEFYVWFSGQLLGFPVNNTGPSQQIRVEDDGNPITVTFTLPEIWNAQGQEMIVHHIIVDFVSYDTGVTDTNHFKPRITAFDIYEGTTETVNAQQFDELPSASSPDGTKRSMKFSVGTQARGRAFQLTFLNIRGVEFKKIKTYGTVEPPRVA